LLTASNYKLLLDETFLVSGYWKVTQQAKKTWLIQLLAVSLRPEIYNQGLTGFDSKDSGIVSMPGL